MMVFLFRLLALLALVSALRAEMLTGVNLAGADFGESSLPGTYGVHYIYPTTDEVDYFYGKGMNCIRLPFRWERLQRSLNAPLDKTELNRIRTVVEHATDKGMRVVLDPHNYARYHGDLIGSSAVPYSAFADFWSRLATTYRDNPHVIFGLMNEPHSMPTEQWLNAANTAITAIRATGAEQLILVPGNAWTGAHSWLQNWYGTPNSSAMQHVVDPADHFAFDVHQYLDSDFSGRSPDVQSTVVGAQALVNFTNWARQHGHRAFLGEFAVAEGETQRLALENMLDYMAANDDVWMGWAWWAAGPWWGNYFFSIEPGPGDADAPQMATLENYFPDRPLRPQIELPASGNQLTIHFDGIWGRQYQLKASPALPSGWSVRGSMTFDRENQSFQAALTSGSETQFFQIEEQE